MNAVSKTAAICSLGLLAGSAASGAEPPEIRNNPFARPIALTATNGIAPLEQFDSPPPRLLATMVSNTQRLANVEGHIVEVGDSIRGYVLTQVFGDSATFESGGEEVTVRVKPEPEENNE